MNEATLASIYGLDMDVGISRTQFLQLCPALIQQKVGGHCDPLPSTTAAPVEKRQTSKAESMKLLLHLHHKEAVVKNLLMSCQCHFT